MEVRVKTSGVCLASLFEQIACSDRDFEGLIIGTQPQVTTSTRVTDTAAVVEKTVCEHNVTSFYRIPGTQNISEGLRQYGQREAKGEGEVVVGWFKFRRNTPLIPSVKEQSVNSTFVRESSDGMGSPLIFILFTEAVNDGGGSHWIRGVKYRAFRSVPVDSSESICAQRLEGIPLEVLNVEATSLKEYGEFKAHSSTKLPQQVLDSAMLLDSSLTNYVDSLAREAQSLIEEINETEETIKLLKKR